MKVNPAFLIPTLQHFIVGRDHFYNILVQRLSSLCLKISKEGEPLHLQAAPSHFWIGLIVSRFFKKYQAEMKSYFHLFAPGFIISLVNSFLSRLNIHNSINRSSQGFISGHSPHLSALSSYALIQLAPFLLALNLKLESAYLTNKMSHTCTTSLSLSHFQEVVIQFLPEELQQWGNHDFLRKCIILLNHSDSSVFP